MSLRSNFSLVSVPFHGDTIEAVKSDDGAVMVSVKRVCESLGISVDAQRIKLQSNEWATTAMVAVVDPNGRLRNHFMIDLESLPLWLGGISASKTTNAKFEALTRGRKSKWTF